MTLPSLPLVSLYFYFSISFVCSLSVQQLSSPPIRRPFLSPPTLFSLRAPFPPPHSFIHILLPQQQHIHPTELRHFLIIISPSLCFYLHSSSSSSTEDFTFISSSFAARSSLSPSVCGAAFPSLPLFLLSRMHLVALSPLLLPNSRPLFSLFLCLPRLFLPVSSCTAL